MYLKYLVLQGFKSFPEKTRLEFNKGVTAIVGPNGSGKSNVSDSIRWVLGEQSAKTLRGAKMEDIIFIGTANRKPLGFAEVTMVIDNSQKKLPLEYSEVAVSRRVYRSGEGEYRINGTICRLKDIHEMFMDTGIGREGYSIIGQGRIDEILSNRGEDRRSLFEEAAGITKFKTRKHEAENKLSKERQNLERVNDIISELDVQLEPLFIQSEKAKKYVELAEKLKLIQINLFLHEVENHQKKIESVREKENIIKSQITDLKENNEELSKKAEVLNGQKEQIERMLLNIQNSLVDLRSKKEQSENDIRLYNEQISNIELNINRLEKELENENNSIEFNKKLQIEKDLELKNTLLDKEEIILNIKSNQKDYEVKSQKHIEFENDFKEYNKHILEYINEENAVDQKILSNEHMYSRFENQIEETNERIKITKESSSEKEMHIKNLENLLKTIEDELINCTQFKDDHENSIRENNNRLLNVTKEFNELNNKIHQGNSRLNLLKEMENSFEGYYKSVKTILKKKQDEPQSLPGVIDIVGKILEIPKEYEIAIEIALGGAIQNIVTKTDNDAKNAIEYLKRTKAGRATFLPISSFENRNNKPDEKILQEDGIIGTASNLVSYNSEFSGIINYLLGRVYIATDIDKAMLISKKYNHSHKIVTLGGDLFNIGGSMSGGSVQSKTSNVFGRTTEIKELTENLEQFNDKKNDYSIEMKEIEDDISKYNDLLTNNRNKMQEFEMKKVSCNQNLEQSKKAYDYEINSIETLSNSTQETLQKLEEINNTIRALKEEKSIWSGKKFELNDKFSDYEENLREIQLSKEKALNELMEMRTREATIDGNIKNIRENHINIVNSIENSTNKIQNIETELKNLKLVKEDKEIDVVAFNKKITEFIEMNESYDKDLSELSEKKKEVLQNISENELSEQKGFKEENSLEQEKLRIEMQKEQMLEAIKRLYDSMWEDYEITLQTAKTFEVIKKSESDLQEESTNIKKEIKDLGDIYVGAIEEYKEKKERFDFLKIQRDDIIDAEEKLVKLIDELTSLMENQFGEQLKLISENFNIVFKEMFNGGNASLKISDSENILESGIDILVQPPGKNLQVLSLLSGGEKALTAIALLFAILRMKPSPFCVLDEIEAALDDANVKRYTKFLKNFSMDTQFILITHKKGTMSAADTLYGVTMQEQGISTLVSVKFNEKMDKTEDVV